MSSKEAPKDNFSPPKITRNIHKNNLITHVKIGCGLALAAAVIFKLTVAMPRQRRYAEFYKDYNAEEEVEKMAEAGVLSSIKSEKKNEEDPLPPQEDSDAPPPPPPIQPASAKHKAFRMFLKD